MKAAMLMGVTKILCKRLGGILPPRLREARPRREEFRRLEEGHLPEDHPDVPRLYHDRRALRQERRVAPGGDPEVQLEDGPRRLHRPQALLLRDDRRGDVPGDFLDLRGEPLQVDDIGDHGRI